MAQYVVDKPNVYLAVQLPGDKEKKVQELPVGSEVDLTLKENARLLKSKSLRLKTSVVKAKTKD